MYRDRQPGLPLKLPMCRDCYERAVQRIVLAQVHAEIAEDFNG